MKSMTHQFLDFAAGKPREEGYDPADTQNCAMAQWVRESFVVTRITALEWETSNGRYGYPIKVVIAAVFAAQRHAEADPAYNTFGALADRLRASLGPSA